MAKTTQPGLIGAVQKAVVNYSNFEGRSTRSEFWWYVLAYVLVLAICGVFDFIRFTDTVSLGSVLASLVAIVTLLPTLAIGVRRLRDAGEGWGHIFWLFLPFAGLIILAILWLQPTRK